MYGLVNIQRDLDASANQGFEHAAALESSREQAWNDIKAADENSRKNAIGMGAGIGMAAGGPPGALIGAAAGYLTYKFL